MNSKKIWDISFVILLSLTLIMAIGCGTGGSPSDVAMAFYKAGNAGKYSEAESYLSFEARAVYKQPMLGITSFDNQMDAVTKGGKITSIEAEGKDYGGGYALVLVTLYYTDGSQASDSLTFFKEDGKWKIAMSTLLIIGQ